MNPGSVPCFNCTCTLVRDGQPLVRFDGYDKAMCCTRSLTAWAPGSGIMGRGDACHNYTVNMHNARQTPRAGSGWCTWRHWPAAQMPSLSSSVTLPSRRLRYEYAVIIFLSICVQLRTVYSSTKYDVILKTVLGDVLTVFAHGASCLQLQSV